MSCGLKQNIGREVLLWILGERLRRVEGLNLGVPQGDNEVEILGLIQLTLMLQ